MTATDWIVVVGGMAAIVWVNWYFFLAERGTAVVASDLPDASGAGDTGRSIAEVPVVVHGGYEPATIRVPAGQPVRLVFDRQETSSCSEEVVFPDFGVRRFLPTGQKVAIELTPPKPGRYEFACGMGMLHGALVAEERASDHA